MLSLRETLTLPPTVQALCVAIRENGGKAYCVGGLVRDAIRVIEGQLGQLDDVRDIDIEAHGIDADRLQKLLKKFGPVSLVGQSFAVFKVATEAGLVEVSLPRTDNKIGPGHKGIEVKGDPDMGIEQATKRRDLTINALAYDPITDELLDLHDGLEDLKHGILRPVDAETFVEDPLRALRVLQFAARFGYSTSTELDSLCASAPIEELAFERVFMELEKLLISGIEPARGLLLGFRWGLWQKVIPEIATLDPTRLAYRVERARPVCLRVTKRDKGNALAFMLAVLLADVPTPDATKVLERFRIKRIYNRPVRTMVKTLRTLWEDVHIEASDGELRLLSWRCAQNRTPLSLLCGMAIVMEPIPAMERVLRRTEELDIAEGPAKRLITGEHLRKLGVTEGPDVGMLLDVAYTQQLLDDIKEEGPLLEAVQEMLQPTDGLASPTTTGDV